MPVARVGPPGQPRPGPGDGGRMGALVDRSGHGGIPCQGRGPGVPDPLPVHPREADLHSPEQVGTLRRSSWLIRRL